MAKKRRYKTAAATRAKQEGKVENSEVVGSSTWTSNVLYIGSVCDKICRLCEGSGPFLDIFTGDKETSKQIQELMPFKVTENDKMPQKICFRCSAKLEELHEFVKKCVKTQQNFCPVKVKTHRYFWEEKLHKYNKKNDEVCDAAIKKSLKFFTTRPPEKTTNVDIRKKSNEKLSKIESEVTIATKGRVPIWSLRDRSANSKETDLKIDVHNDNQSRRSSRSNKAEPLLEGLEDKSKKVLNQIKPVSKKKADADIQNTKPEANAVENSSVVKACVEKASVEKASVETASVEKASAENKVKEAEAEKKPFNIMDHVMMIKVRGVGTLYQCKLCNKNFMSNFFFMTHWCAKNGSAKEDFTKRYIPPQPQKAPTVKYITTNANGGINKMETKPDNIKLETKLEEVPPVVRKKPRIGPASKVKRIPEEETYIAPPQPRPPPQTITPASQPVKSPAYPSLSLKYKLLVGQNNKVTMVEAGNNSEQQDRKVDNVKKRKLEDDDCRIVDYNPSLQQQNYYKPSSNNAVTIRRLTAPATQTSNQVIQQKNDPLPYPVGMFRTIAQTGSQEPCASSNVQFAVPASKRPSYTVIKTKNPNKLLISTRAVDIERAIRKQKKHKHSPKTEEKDPDFFTFVNVDPMLTPSYVLPTDNLVQESQITTSATVSRKAGSTNTSQAGNYTCNICNEKFSREQKLLVHIQSHYNTMDTVDEERKRKRPKKRH